MPRLPYLPADLAEPAEIVDAIRRRRGGALLNLDRQLLRSPPVARGWNALMGAVRAELNLSARHRELAMCAVAVLNGADYEFIHHAPIFLQAGGTQAQVQALRQVEQAARDEQLFDAKDRAVLMLTIEMTRSVSVGDSTFEAVRSALPDEREVFELVAVIAAYNMVSRVLVALGVEPE
jgi:alkylhydroperoxidase family enzyme